jgi:hypothetical protein
MKTLWITLLYTAMFSPAFAVEKDTRCFEMRTYYAAPGKLDELHTRFREHTCKLFEKHGIVNIGYWVPQENSEQKLIYILAYPSREAREKSWKEFMADPEWKAVYKASEAKGKLVTKVVTLFLQATDYSPEIKPYVVNEPRVFELRTYTASPGNLDALHVRFRDHTVALFSRHGMTQLGYWTPMPDQKDADNTLVYILAHKNKEAAEASFQAFRADPDWIKVRKASEEKAGGSLTAKDGVQSVFLNSTDYSQTK